MPPHGVSSLWYNYMAFVVFAVAVLAGTVLQLLDGLLEFWDRFLDLNQDKVK